MLVAYKSYLPTGMPKSGTKIHAYQSGDNTLCGIKITLDFWIHDFPQESINCKRCKKILKGELYERSC